MLPLNPPTVVHGFLHTSLSTVKEAVRGMSADVKFTSDGFCTFSGRINLAGQTGSTQAPSIADTFLSTCGRGPVGFSADGGLLM